MPNRKTKAILKPMATQSIPTASEIKAIRKRLGLTQIEMARRLHVDRTNVWQWENEAAKPSKQSAYLIELLSDGILPNCPD